MSIEIKSTCKVSGGQLIRFSHNSNETKTPMVCAVFLPTSAPKDDTSQKFATLLYLSGLTCTDENVCQKSGVFKRLSEYKMAFIAPDTSPRGAGIAGEDDGWDFGTGAGFYLDATAGAWANNYRMYSYVTKELIQVLATNFPALDLSRLSITGHSMGGHGALTIALKNQELFRSVSAFSPICNPINCPWGVKAFTGYLGDDKKQWEDYDASVLLQSIAKKADSAVPTKFDDILIDVGTNDNFLKGGQLLPEAFQNAADATGQKITLRYQDGYDHSYYFISTFIDDHIDFHALRLGATRSTKNFDKSYFI